ncbi:MAG: 3-hydroxyacyl-CoA dehydrogenase family protein [Clostridia bacterium]|nr:3-hydroxyacyl-CoA dehydrogenase family protein [Clostridia bacterium]
MNSPDISRAVVAGAGTMGASLAQIFAKHGIIVDFWNRSREGLDRAEALIISNQKALVDSGHITAAESEALTGRINAVTDESCFENAVFVIESIAENMAVKKSFFGNISDLVPEDCVIVTNTSGLSVTELGADIRNQERFAGMHWVNPPHLIPLVEVIKGEMTNEGTMDLVYALALRLGKKPIRAKDVPGFVLNRLQFAVMREALSLVESGAAGIEDIDGAMKYGLGFRYACLGPFETADLGGVDIFYKIASYLFADLEDRKDVPEMLKSLFDNGSWGVKSGRGFYDYSGAKAKEAVENRDRKIMMLYDALYGD